MSSSSELSDWDSGSGSNWSSGSDSSVSSSSTDSDSDSDSDSSPDRHIVTLAEVLLLKRDNLGFARLPVRQPPPAPPPPPPQNPGERYKWWDVLRLLLAFSLAVVLVWTGILFPIQQQQMVPVPVPIRPSDTFAIRKVAFNLPSRWSEWIALPPLGITYWKKRVLNEEGREPRQRLSALQGCVRTMDKRIDYRQEVRDAWGGALTNITVWLERMEECTSGIHRLLDSDADTDCKTLLFEAAEGSTGIEKLRKVIDDILNHIVRHELRWAACFDSAFSGLLIASEARIRTIDKGMNDLAVEAARRQPTAVRPPVLHEEDRSLLLLLSDAEKFGIALAREEYGILTFLSLLSSAVPPVLEQRKEGFLDLRFRLTALEQHIAVEHSKCTRSLGGRSCRVTVVRNVLDRLPTIAELDAKLKEKALNGPAIRRLAGEWMNAHTREQQQQHSLPNLASPFSRSTPNTTALPDHLAAAAKQIHHLTWTHPTLGAASWHWEGSGPPAYQFAPSSITPKEQLEGALLFAGLDVPDPEDYAGFLATGERWEDYRYRMIPRGDGQDVKESWPSGYKVRSRVAEGLESAA